MGNAPIPSDNQLNRLAENLANRLGCDQVIPDVFHSHMLNEFDDDDNLFESFEK